MINVISDYHLDYHLREWNDRLKTTKQQNVHTRQVASRSFHLHATASDREPRHDLRNDRDTPVGRSSTGKT